MVRNARVADYEAVARTVLAIGNDYPAGHETAPHHHRRAQLLYAMSGIMLLATSEGTWLVPPDRAFWIPPGVVHGVRSTGGPLAMRSLFIEPEAMASLPDACRMVEISPLIRALILEAVDLPVEYDAEGRAGMIMNLLLHEVASLPALPVGLPIPSDRRLADLCRRFVDRPDPHARIDDWCEALGTSRRSFTRLFRNETGMSFAQWRQRACLFAALPRLGAGEAVTTVALDLGYDSVAAFTTMFGRVLGASPSRYFRNIG